MNELLQAESFLTETEREQVKAAIAEAELRTSGEIRVHLDDHIVDTVLDHAAFVFEELEMDQTALKNGVLFYISVPDNKIAVIGDDGINKVVPEGFWQEVLDLVLRHFKQQQFAQGLVEGIKLAGEKLAEHFPYQDGDTNELPNNISIGHRR